MFLSSCCATCTSSRSLPTSSFAATASTGTGRGTAERSSAEVGAAARRARSAGPYVAAKALRHVASGPNVSGPDITPRANAHWNQPRTRRSSGARRSGLSTNAGPLLAESVLGLVAVLPVVVGPRVLARPQPLEGPRLLGGEALRRGEGLGPRVAQAVTVLALDAAVGQARERRRGHGEQQAEQEERAAQPHSGPHR